MRSLVRPELPTASIGSSQAPTAAVDNSAPSATRPQSTYKSGKAVQTNGATSEDWAKRLDTFLEFTERDVLQDSGKVSAEMAKAHAESEFEKYRIVQDRLFESDFDRVLKQIDGPGDDSEPAQ